MHEFTNKNNETKVQSMYKAIFLIFLASMIFFSSSHFVFAAELSGTIYDDSLDVAKNVLVVVNTIPQQRMLSVNGEYHFSIPKGSYELNVTYTYKNLEYIASEDIHIVEDGDFVYDVFLFPGLDLETNEITVFENESFLLEDEIISSNPNTVLILFSLLAVVFLLLLVFFVSRLKKRSDKESFFEKAFFLQKLRVHESDKTAQKNPHDSDDLCKQILEVLSKNNNRMTQKDLRKEFPLSESAISLAVSELEHKGKVEKIRKGRLNIIIKK